MLYTFSNWKWVLIFLLTVLMVSCTLSLEPKRTGNGAINKNINKLENGEEKVIDQQNSKEINPTATEAKEDGQSNVQKHMTKEKLELELDKSNLKTTRKKEKQESVNETPISEERECNKKNKNPKETLMKETLKSNTDDKLEKINTKTKRNKNSSNKEKKEVDKSNERIKVTNKSTQGAENTDNTQTNNFKSIKNNISSDLKRKTITRKRPHIIFIMADDLGWNDVGYNNPFVQSPVIDKLAKSGVIFNQSYVQSVCTPSRAAFLTGRYPFRYGFQHFVLNDDRAQCLPEGLPMLPERLKELGYSTHLVGKWHLGYCNWRCTPLYKGFDSFYGFYNGGGNHYDHTLNGYLDLWDNHNPAVDHNNEYSTSLFGKKAVNKIEDHDPENAMFLFLSFQAPHNPLQVPKHYEDLYPDVKCTTRKKYLGMVTAMDEQIGNVVEALKKKGMYEDSLLVFTTDNGGVDNMNFGGGSNYPLRGEKATLWEGGTRGVAFVHGSMLHNTDYVHNGLFHITDWFKTLLSAAGGQSDEELDSIDQWSMIQNGTGSGRNEMVYNIDNYYPSLFGKAAIRNGDYKLIEGNAGLKMVSGWKKPINTTCSATWFQSILYYATNWLPRFINDRIGLFRPSIIYQYLETQYEKEIEEGIIAPTCKNEADTFYTNMHNVKLTEECIPQKIWLFNLKDDPYERNNIAHEHPEIVKDLLKKLDRYKKAAVPAIFPDVTDDSHPSNFDGYHSAGWC